MSPTQRLDSSQAALFRGYSITAIPVFVTVLEALPVVPLVQGAIAKTRVVVSRGVAVLAEVRIIPVTAPPPVIPTLFLSGVVTGVQGCLPQFIRAAELAITTPVASPAIVVVAVPVAIPIISAIAIILVVVVVLILGVVAVL